MARIVCYETLKHTGDGEDATVVLPRSANLADSGRRLSEAVDALSAIFSKPQIEILTSILKEDRDIIRLRLPTSQSVDSVSLDAASRLIPKWRDFVAFAACAEIKPKPYIVKATKAGREFAESCRFGHTFKGSFGFTVEVPHVIHNELVMDDMPEQRPFTRAVTERIARGLVAAKNAIEQHNPDVLVRAYPAGLNANMCEILSDVQEILPDSDIEYSLEWAPALPVADELARISFTAEDAEANRILKTATEMLERLEVPSEKRDILGRVIELKSKAPPLDTADFKFAERSIVLLWEIEKGASVNLHLPLSLDDYRTACTAHTEGRKMKISGIPTKRGKFWYLEHSEGFAVV